jgi:putative endonuclease
LTIIYVYILRCSDGSYYVGITRGALETRVLQHDVGTFGGYTVTRRPVTLVWQPEFQYLTDAIAAERRIKGWTRAKKAPSFEAISSSCTHWRAIVQKAINTDAVRPSTRDASHRGSG